MFDRFTFCKVGVYHKCFDIKDDLIDGLTFARIRSLFQRDWKVRMTLNVFTVTKKSTSYSSLKLDDVVEIEMRQRILRRRRGGEQGNGSQSRIEDRNRIIARNEPREKFSSLSLLSTLAITNTWDNRVRI